MNRRGYHCQDVTSTPLNVQRFCVSRSATSVGARHAGSIATRDRFEVEAERMAGMVTGVSASSLEPWIAAPHGTGASSMADGDGNGQPLSRSLRASLEPHFGYDFSHVRVHTDGLAAQRARSLDAEAYAVGRHIGFAPGRFAPHSPQGRWLLAHELTHVIQQDPAAPLSAVSPVSRSAATVMPYRSKKSPNFGTCDGGGLTEVPFKSKDKDPWIENISVNFTATTTDDAGDLIPTGTLTAQYFANPVKRADISASIVGGKASQGLNDRGNHRVTRIEGCGYNQTAVAKADRVSDEYPGKKHFKPGKTDLANMSFAVFYKEGKASGNQAIHLGSLVTGSLSCVHVDAENPLRQINYHSREGKTKVVLGYSAGPLKELCCARFAAMGRMVSNPCGGQDAKKCP